MLSRESEYEESHVKFMQIYVHQTTIHFIYSAKLAVHLTTDH